MFYETMRREVTNTAHFNIPYIQQKSSNLGHCIRVSKFRELNKVDYEKIISKWLTAEDTKSKRRKISAYMKK